MVRQKKERRSFPRLKTNVPFKITGKDFTIVTDTINISRSGIYCSVDRPIGLMSKVGVAIVILAYSGRKTVTKTIKCNGVVVRAEFPSREERPPRFKVAIYFTDLSGKDAGAVRKYVDYQQYKSWVRSN